MSDLAPFVAAAIRDKVVEDLMAEIEALKGALQEEIRHSRLVQIVTDCDSSLGKGIVLQEHPLDSGYIEGESWIVDFDYKGGPFPKCTLWQLRDTILTVGGVKVECFDIDPETVVEIQGTSCDGEDVIVSLRVGCCYIFIDIHGWPIAQYVPRGVASVTWEYIMDIVPESMVTFHRVEILYSVIEGLAERIPCDSKEESNEPNVAVLEDN